MVDVWLVGTATVTTQGPNGSCDTTNEERDFQLAKTGDSDSATSGDFFMATDTVAWIRDMPVEGSVAAG